MDDIKPREGRYDSSRMQHRRKPSSSTPGIPVSKNERHQGEIYWLVRSLGKAASKSKKNLWHRFQETDFAKWPDKSKWQRFYASLTLVLFIISTIAALVQPFLDNRPNNISYSARSVLPEPNQNLADYLDFDAKEAKFIYNAENTGAGTPDLAKVGNGTPRISASFNKDPSKGVTVTDALNQIDFSLKPKFRLLPGKQDSNQLFYQLGRADGYLVYTAQIASVKEDIVLESSNKDRMVFEYELVTAEGTEARLEENGSIGVYGTDLPVNGNVSTGTEKDAELLQKVRQNAAKTKFLFGIPAPVVKESGKKESSVTSKFELEGSNLKVVSEGLKSASYPLSIDPSVYVQSAVQLMRGNNETNVEFDVATEQFKKGTTTGARIDEWTDTTDMNGSVWDQGVAAAGGYVYRAGGRTSRIMPEIVEQKITTRATNSTSFVMDMPTNRPAGDLYIAIIAHDGIGTVAPPGVGGAWTEYADTREHAAYYKIGENISGGNEAATYTWTTSSVESAGVILRIRDFNSADIVSGTAGTGSNAAEVAPVYPATTPDTQGTLMIRAASFDDDVPPASGYSPTNHTDIASGNSGGAADAGFVVSVPNNQTLSGVSSGTATVVGVTDTYGASSIAINGITVTSAIQSSVQWAHFSSTNGSIESPAPGSNGALCSGWCTNSAYDLPTDTTVTTNGAGKVGMSMVAYNGYLYVMGGNDGTQIKSTVYIAKLGINGEPSLWHPTNPTEASWVYWYKDTGLNAATAKQYLSAYASNGRMYVVGGDTNTTANSGASTDVHIADIQPDGRLGTWAAGPVLGTARYGATVQAYNDYLYVLGGNNNGTMITGSTASTSNGIYSKINSNGTLNAWTMTSADSTSATFVTPRSSHGGLMSGIWGGYMYLAGGCTVVNASGFCTTTATDVQLASINADGTLDAWNTMIGLKNNRYGYSFIAWQDSLYRFGGCEFQDPTTGECYGTHKRVQYGNINQDGDASTVSITAAAGSGLCSGNDPYDCNLPPAGDGDGLGGQMLSSTAILNGYLYVIGGCTTFDTGGTDGANPDCATGTAVSGNVSYVAIASDGKLKSPPSCSGTVYGSWCVDSTNRVNGTTGVAASGIAVLGGFIYVVGGLTGGGNANSIYRNSTNADGSLTGTWTAQTFNVLGVIGDHDLNPGTGVAAINISYTFAYARANPSSAGTYPGNLYIFGGCGESSGAGCSNSNYREEVWKCNITTTGGLEEADANDCTTTSQLQIDTEAAAGNQGIGIHAGTVYANYIYLIGGLSLNVADRKTVFYAKFDNSNNVVAVSGGVWAESPVQLTIGRRRGTAFGYNGYLYAVGGFEATGSQVLDTIEFVKLNVSDGSLISSNNLFLQSAVTINQRWGLGLAVSNSYAYVIGGCNVGASPSQCSSFDPSVQTFQVYNNDSGAPGGYVIETDLFATDRIGASAAVYNGYLYVAGGCTSTTDCTTATNSVQYAALDAYGAVGAWSAGGNLPNARAWGQLEVAGGTLYFLGGQESTATNESADVYYTTSFSSGNPTWSGTAATKGVGDTGSGGQARTKFSSTVWNNRIYVTGGLDINAAATTTVYISPQLNSGGNITTNWSTGTAINVARSAHVTIAYANNLYVYGGFTGTNYLSDSQFTQINTDGTLDAWTYTTSLPIPLAAADGFAVNGYMYLLGGRSSTNDCMERTLVAPISANTTIATGNNPTGIGEWYETNRRFDQGRYGAAAVYNQGKAYVLGGACQGTVMQDDFDATVDAAEWSNTTGMTAGTTCQSTSDSNVFYLTTGGTTNQAATKDVSVTSGGTVYFKLYMPSADIGGCFRGESTGGGLLASPVLDNVEFEYSINAGGAWTQIGGDYQYDGLDPFQSYAVTIPAGAQTAATRFRWIMRDGEASDSFALEDVKIIATNSTTLTYTGTKRTQYSPLLSQPQVAIYSRLIDANKDVFPTVWLMNGLDNSIGARWQLRYRSSNDPSVTDALKACGGAAMTGYGLETNYGDVTLGQPGPYTVKNSGGTNIGCGRYFFMRISIDASQTYGYPDDIARGPTLTDLALFFKANPGQRLLHGKTFIEGTQQPLDTQCGISNPVDTADVCPNP